MRHNILASLLLATFFISACTNTPKVDLTIWEGNTRVIWNDPIMLDSTLFEHIETGDELVVGFDYDGDHSEWPGVALYDTTYNEMAGTGKIDIHKGETEACFCVTKEMNRLMHTEGVYLMGLGYNARYVGVRKHKFNIDTIDDNTLWFGNVDMEPAWCSFLNISRKTFYQTNVGDILNIHLSGVGDTSKIMLHTNKWSEIPNSLCDLKGDSVFQYPLDHTILELIRRDNGITISGTACKVTKIDITKPLWNGNEYINWFKPKFIQLSPEAFKDIKLGDKLFICLAFIENDEWPQIALLDTAWHDLPGTGRTLVYPETTNLTFNVTNQQIDILKSEGLVVAGLGYVLKSVSILHDEPQAYMENAKWIGCTKMVGDWSVVQRLSPACFTDAEDGDIMRLSISNIRNGAIISIRPGSWGYFKNIDTERLDTKADHYDFELTPYLLNEIRNNMGCVVFGTGYTLNAMHIIKKQ